MGIAQKTRERIGGQGKVCKGEEGERFGDACWGFGVAHCQMGVKASWDVHDSPEESNLQDA